MGWGTVVGAGVSALGSLLGTSMSSSAAEKLARKQMDLQFQAQKELYQNRYQWSTADAQAAGLNPILTASQGPGSAGQVSALPVQAPDYGGALARGISSAIGILNAEADLTNKAKQSEVLDAQKYMLRGQAANYWADSWNKQRELDFYSDNPDVYRMLMVKNATPKSNSAYGLIGDLMTYARAGWSLFGGKGK